MMLSFLKSHPFAVEAYFEHSIVLTFAIPKKELIDMIPPCLQLDTFDDQWAFVAVAMVKTKALRPKGFPKIMGNDFFLIGYRIFVRYTNNAGKRLRGLYILQSQTNRKRMEYLGNIFTHYQYSTIDINDYKKGGIKHIQSTRAKLNAVINVDTKEVELPTDSPFNNWKEARRFAGPLPFTFSYLPKSEEVIIVEGVRQNWIPKPVEVIKYNISVLNNFHFKNPKLASAFIITDIPYYWKKGKTEKWSK